MGNNNYANAQKALQSVKLKNTRIILNKGKNEKQCVNITVYDNKGNLVTFKRGSKILDRFATSTIYTKESFQEIFEIIDSGENPYIDTLTKEECLANQNLDKILSKYEPPLPMIFRLHYGLAGGKPMTLRQIGEKLNLTGERIRNLIDRNRYDFQKKIRKNKVSAKKAVKELHVSEKNKSEKKVFEFETLTKIKGNIQQNIDDFVKEIDKLKADIEDYKEQQLHFEQKRKIAEEKIQELKYQLADLTIENNKVSKEMEKLKKKSFSG